MSSRFSYKLFPADWPSADVSFRVDPGTEEASGVVTAAFDAWHAENATEDVPNPVHYVSEVSWTQEGSVAIGTTYVDFGNNGNDVIESLASAMASAQEGQEFSLRLVIGDPKARVPMPMEIVVRQEGGAWTFFAQPGMDLPAPLRGEPRSAEQAQTAAEAWLRSVRGHDFLIEWEANDDHYFGAVDYPGLRGKNA